MKIKFWGTRGSIPTPGPSTIKYGGNTSCVELQSKAGTLVILDCGSGLRGLGKFLMENGPHPLHGHILISHTHWDHIQGLPFFSPLFVPGNEWDIYAPRGFENSLHETLAGQMQYTYFPVNLDQLGSNIRYHELVEGEFKIDDILVKTQYLNHTALTLGYRLEADGVSIIYATDHEPHVVGFVGMIRKALGDQDQHHADFLSKADLVIHDAQYIAEEYEEKRGWGHSTIEYAIEVCRAADVKKLVITHHDPLRDDQAIDRIVEMMQKKLHEEGSAIEVIAAAEGMVLTLEGKKGLNIQDDEKPSALNSRESALVGHSVLLGIADWNTAATLLEAVEANGIQATLKKDGKSVIDAALANPPSLIILDQYLPDMDGPSICRILRSYNEDLDANMPVIILVDQEKDVGNGKNEGITDWLVKPFSILYARTRVRAWLLRTTCRWARAPLPSDEKERLEILKRLKIIDTQPEERFDRLTRLASALFGMPIVRITLLTEDRQWFKSCQGPGVKESSRETSFCAHSIARHVPLVVADTFQDDRFADNPLVTGAPFIRFYAGQPLILADGVCVGTICLIDTRPRFIDDKSMTLLKDIGDLIVRELMAPTE